jgi:hypothetical protein
MSTIPSKRGQRELAEAGKLLVKHDSSSSESSKRL